jgi:hypothetical protein
MGTIEVYNFLDGKNLCNIFASLIVNEINKTFPNANTEITVVNIRNFFIVRGRTTSDVVLNLTNILIEFLKNYDDEDLLNIIRVIDVINYNTSFDNRNMDIGYHSDKLYEKEKLDIQEFVNSHVKDKLYFNIKLEKTNNYLYFDCFDSNVEKVKEIISNKFPNHKIIKTDLSQETYVSDRYYGLSNDTEKLYHILLRYITYNVFSLGISKELNMKLYSKYRPCEIDNLNSEFEILNNNHTVRTNWLRSLILDVFPFNHKDLSNSFDISNYDSSVEVLSPSDRLLWEKLDMVSEMVLL